MDAARAVQDHGSGNKKRPEDGNGGRPRSGQEQNVETWRSRAGMLRLQDVRSLDLPGWVYVYFAIGGMWQRGSYGMRYMHILSTVWTGRAMRCKKFAGVAAGSDIRNI